jgi:hypothetical protein
MTHVAAWVALLPLEAALLPECAHVLSLFLQRHLRGVRLERSRRRASSKNLLWLRGTLHLVARRLKELRADAHGGLAEHWLHLRRSMPRSVWKSLRATCPAIDTVGEEAEHGVEARPGKDAEHHGAVSEGAQHEVEAHPGREAEHRGAVGEGAQHGVEAHPGREDEVKAVLQEATASLEAGDADRIHVCICSLIFQNHVL